MSEHFVSSFKVTDNLGSTSVQPNTNAKKETEGADIALQISVSDIFCINLRKCLPTKILIKLNTQVLKGKK